MWRNFLQLPGVRRRLLNCAVLGACLGFMFLLMKPGTPGFSSRLMSGFQLTLVSIGLLTFRRMIRRLSGWRSSPRSKPSETDSSTFRTDVAKMYLRVVFVEHLELKMSDLEQLTLCRQDELVGSLTESRVGFLPADYAPNAYGEIGVCYIQEHAVLAPEWSQDTPLAVLSHGGQLYSILFVSATHAEIVIGASTKAVQDLHCYHYGTTKARMLEQAGE